MAFPPRVKLALLAAALLLFLLGVLLVVLPTVLVNRPEARAAIQRYVQAAWGAEVSYDRIQLSLLPRACATVDHPRLVLPGAAAARAAAVDLCLKLLPLLRGRLVADAVRAESPEVVLSIAPGDGAGLGPGFPDPRPLLARMAAAAGRIPATAIEVTDGRVDLAAPDGRGFAFRGLNLRLRRGGGELEWSLDGESPVAGRFSSKGRLETDTLRGTSTLQVTDGRPQPLWAFFRPNAPLQVLDAQLDLHLALAMEGPERLTAAVTASAPALALAYRDHPTRLSVERCEARLELSEKRVAVSVSEFSSLVPRTALELALVSDEEARPKVGLRLRGSGDLAGVRDVVRAMLPERPDVRLTCEILRSGQIPRIQVDLLGESWADLADPSNLSIEGRLENGRLYLPWIDLELHAVSGDALIAGGILEGRDLKARYKGTDGENGSLRVGLSRTDPVLQLAIDARADLAALPPLLARIVPDPAFRREVARLQEFSGTARGTLRLDGTHTDVAVEVQASDLDVAARHPAIAYPLRLQGGEAAYDGDSIALRGVDVAVGASRLFKHNLTIGLHGDRALDSGSPGAVIDLAELFDQFRNRPPFDRLRRLKGILATGDWRLNGLAFDPATWRLSTQGTVQDLLVESDLAPGPVQLSASRLAWSDRTIRYQSAHGSINRSAVKGLTVELDWTETPRLQLRALEMDAALDDLSRILPSFPKTAAHAAALGPLSGFARMRGVRLETRLLPEGPRLDRFEAEVQSVAASAARIGLPLTLSGGSIGWQGSRLELRAGQAALGRSEVRRLSASADWGGGDLALSADGAVIALAEVFPHALALADLAGVREDVRRLGGVLSASRIQVNGPLQEPRRWRVQAEAEFKDIVLTPTFLDDPIELPAGRLTFAPAEAPGPGPTVLRLDAVRVRTGGDEAVLAGDIRLSAADATLDLDLMAAAVDWSKVETIADRLGRRRQADSRPLRGRLSLRLERLVIDRVHLYPLQAAVHFTAAGPQIEIERAGYCGLTFIGRMAFDGPVVDAYLVPVADVMPLDGFIACLSEEKSLFSGHFNLHGQLSAKARRGEMVNALKGRLTFVAEDGTLRQSLLFARLFALLNLTEIYRGRLPDFSSQGLDYKRSTAVLDIRDGQIHIDDGSIDGRTLWIGARGEIDIATQQIDFTIMVSPFKTIDRIVNSIPGLRWVLGGRLVAIPMRATGSLEDPQVVPLSPAAVGTSILEMIERTLLLPIEIIQPLVPGLEETPSSTIRR